MLIPFSIKSVASSCIILLLFLLIEFIEFKLNAWGVWVDSIFVLRKLKRNFLSLYFMESFDLTNGTTASGPIYIGVRNNICFKTKLKR